MSTEDSLNQSMNKAHRHYSSLFFLPSFKTALVGVAVMSLLAGLTSAVFHPGIEGLSWGLVLGATIFALNFLVDSFISKKILGDPVFVLRRTVVLSFFGWIFWLAIFAVGVALGLLFGSVWWIKLILLGFATLLTLRTVVLFSVATASLKRRLFAILLQPFASILPFAFFWGMSGVSLIDFVPFIIVSPFIAIISAYFFIHIIDRMGQETNGYSSITLFKAFMLNWVAALNAPLEKFLEEMGKDEDIEVSLLKFESTKPTAAFIVPLIHPGPFKNIGSSLLPSLLKKEYERVLGGTACVPLGLLGHELDAASQAQNRKVIDNLLRVSKFDSSIEEATPLVRWSEGFVSASCQIFGKTAFLSFTLAPKTTEDLPQELGAIVREEAGKLGLDFAIVVNSHNSITDSTKIEATIEILREVASKCLQKGVSQKFSPFSVGAATVYPSEFSLKDGMGTGGITGIVIKVAEKKAVYVVIDGNNMISGLREKILVALEKSGFPESEIFTTDTHAVSAVVVGRRGYHPLGEAMNHDQLIAYVTRAVKTADNTLESCKAGYLNMVIPKVRVIGSECLESISLLVDRTIQKAKRIIVPIFAAEGLFLVLLLALL